MKEILKYTIGLSAGLWFFVAFISSTFADPGLWVSEGWKTDFSRLTVPAEDILSGGPPKDGIPPIDRPKFIAVAESKDLTNLEPVIGLELNGDARAYPLRVMTWHEIVNDVVGDTPVVVTYCPLCNAAIVFDAKIDGKPVTFGTTGKLRNSDLIMYDRATESWWQQFSGTAIAGTLSGAKLKRIPARLESWEKFKSRHPNGKVLVPNDPTMRDYGRNPYQNYDQSSAPFLYRGEMPDGISPMARVVVVSRQNQTPLIFSMELVRKNAQIEQEGIVLKWHSGQTSALHHSQISKGRDVGGIIVTNKKDGKDMVYDVTFAFVAHAFHPEVAIKMR